MTHPDPEGSADRHDLRPWPLADRLTAPFWEAAARHRLVVQRCSGCDTLRWPPSERCPVCHAGASVWTELSGNGTLYSFIVDHRNMIPGFTGAYAVGLVTPDEVTDHSVRFVTNLPGCRHDQLQIGMPLTVTFEEVRPGISLPQFTLPSWAQPGRYR
jgi:uncharacterized OB-fold protein